MMLRQSYSKISALPKSYDMACKALSVHPANKTLYSTLNVMHSKELDDMDAKQTVEYAKDGLNSGIGRLAEVCFTSGEGSWLTDLSGKKYLDFTSGIGVVNTGHCHPRVVKAVQEQAAKLPHLQVNIGYHAPMVELIAKLREIMPSPKLDTFFFWNSGAEAVEASIKTARHYTKKNNIIAMRGGYHGRTMGTMALTTSKTVFSAGFGPFCPGVFIAPFPYFKQMPSALFHETLSAIPGTPHDSYWRDGGKETSRFAKEAEDYCIESIKLMLKQETSPSDTAAILMEPVLGEGGYVVPPRHFIRRIKEEICEPNGILLILDEVQTGFGRTGKMFASEYFDVTPDIMVFAKGIASGYPISGIVSRKEIMHSQPAGSMGGTYAGNAVSCAAANATIDIMTSTNILDSSLERGNQLVEGVLDIALRHPHIKGLIREVRGVGLMIGIDFEQNMVSPGFAARVSKECLNRGLLLLTTSCFETLRFIPPLNVTEDEVKEGLHIFEAALLATST
eukprot:Nk52_evm4s328 gene=Nk52_evmTU4s328